MSEPAISLKISWGGYCSKTGLLIQHTNVGRDARNECPRNRVSDDDG